MKRELYNISYGSPLRVKDRPHRSLETSRSVYDTPEWEDSSATQTVQGCETTDAVDIVENKIEEVEPICAE